MQRHSGLVAIMSDFQPEGQWFKPGLCRRAVSLGPLHMSPVPGLAWLAG